MKRFLILMAACGRPAALSGGDAPGPVLDGAVLDGTALDAASVDSRSIDGVSLDARPDAPPDSFIVEMRQLGMNDISLLLALPADPTTPTLATMAGFEGTGDLVPREVFAMTTAGGATLSAPYEQFHIVAVRFDVCDRAVTGPCDVAADGQLRLSFQPLTETTPTKASDASLHAAYGIPSASMPYVVNELRALARLQNLDPASPLKVNPLTAGSTSEYASRLSALVAGYARPSSMIRLTVLSQLTDSPFQWQASGLQRGTDGTFQFFSIPTQPVGPQWLTENIYALYAGGQPPTYNITLAEDIPAGFITAVDNPSFTNGTAAAREQALESLAAILNPSMTTSQTVQCADCHVATYLDTLRLNEAGVSRGSIPGTYTSTHDLSVAAGMSTTDNLSVRVFGWRDDRPEISLRVANDTAMVLDELETRFPTR